MREKLEARNDQFSHISDAGDFVMIDPHHWDNGH